ncbi:glycosyl transferase family 2 [Anseongella ginsenosidimutans]|uniref:Glycosyl transferase family 2 n=1 Tax=Anseongella ginsenosidimutans TaxID=496056 RepID=A0A4R3KNI9_9SPHI|nr:glycosyltransferase family 2 protein [Anseongella ginsenosidimutans]QEC52081.1 glycosyltransferase [Anseongella ginsenosidimutans]TCS85609.1 glycosyl transferase family 2 [Anseongella ginsenosidimutans]
MSTDIHLSVITVTFNCRELLPRTLESVQAQAFSSIEHIIVDGASTDGTLELIRENEAYLGAWISEPDKGIYDAMNKGLRMARGKYVLFLNAGDTFYSEGTLLEVFSAPAAGEASIVSGEAISGSGEAISGSGEANTVFGEANSGSADIYYGQTKLTDLEGRITGDRRLKAPEQLNWRSFRYGMLVCHQSFIVRRAIAPEYDLSWRICADIDWCIRCMKAAEKIENTHSYISCFLEGGISRQQEKKAWKERFAIMKKYYGLGETLLSHLYIAFRFLRH